MSTLVCRDCGWVARCPACDLLMRVHTKPNTHLLCHFCETKGTIPDVCPKCQSTHLVQSGPRIQSIEASLKKIFPEAKILLVEDLSKLSKKTLDQNTIVIGTQKITSLPIENLGLTAFLLVESDLSVPAYDIEEDLFSQVRHFTTRSENIILQTRSPKLQIIKDITEGNFKSFFQRTLQERKSFHLPPFLQMVTIYLSDKSESMLKQRINTLASSLMQRADKETLISYDHLLIEKRAGEYRQKILIRAKDVMGFLEQFRNVLVRSRGVEVEWL